jgi:hypothetical protein
MMLQYKQQFTLIAPLFFMAVLMLSSRTQGFSATPPQFTKSPVVDGNSFHTRQVVRKATSEDASAPSAPAPILNGKRILPYKVMKGGLKGSKVAAVYALLNDEYKRG